MNGDSRDSLLKTIIAKHSLTFNGASALSGGDINEVYLLSTEEGKYVIKLNDSQKFPGMFEAEKSGLEALSKPKVIDVPEVFVTGEEDSLAYLILEYKNSSNKKPGFWEDFGNQMADLHKISADQFGFPLDNYIGSLPQYNENRSSAAKFYIEMRLQPQIRMAEDRGFDLNIKESFYKNCESIIPDEKPSLVHGDLWGGNYLVNNFGKPCLIDPATAYAPREMDIGMMNLFGGFENRLFEVYNESFPLQPDWKERIPLWQLYYLLVHLNIFGAGYRSQVVSIIKRHT